MSKKILHLGGASVFMPPFLKIIKEEFDDKAHHFILLASMADAELKEFDNVQLFNHKKLSAIYHYFKIVMAMFRADKIILHGLNDPRLTMILAITPFVKNKTYWLIWGADLYTKKFDERNARWKFLEFFREKVIKNIGNMVTYIKGDYDLACEWYESKAKYHECFMYPSNLYKDYLLDESRKNINGTLNLMVGNSACPSNNHLEVFEQLEFFKNKSFHVYSPLTYGDPLYRGRIVDAGEEYFGDKFIPLIEHLSLDEYLDFLSKVDIVIFNHPFQQAMGNTITLLGLGKKVFLRSDVAQWELFQSLGVEVGDVAKIDLTEAGSAVLKKNKVIIKKHFSKENYLEQLKGLFR